MNLYDLNLLSTFDALYELRSTTRAAERLGLSQSAVSHALRRLRETIGDPLFVRGARALQPTARANEMAPAVREGLTRLRSALTQSSFDPATVERTISLAAGSYFCSLIGPRLIAHSRKVAPGITFQLVPMGKDIPAALETGAVDIAIGVFDQVPSRFATEPLIDDEFIWIGARSHPLAGRTATRADLDGYPRLQVGSAYPFGLPPALVAEGGILISPVSGMSDFQRVNETGADAVVYEMLSAMITVAASDLMAQVPRRMAEHIGPGMGIVPLETAEKGPRFSLTALWHSRLQQDAGIRWLIDQLKRS